MDYNDYKAWLVDLDGTLYPFRPVRWAMAAQLLMGHWRALKVVRAFRRAHEMLRTNAADINGSPYARQIDLTAVRLGCDRAEVEQTIEEWMIRRPGPLLRRYRRNDLIEEIREFRGGGGRTAVVSDYPAKAKIDAMELGELFDIIVANGEPGGPSRLKPQPDGYLLAAEKLGVSPAECLVIGDRLDADGLAAEAAGMAFRQIA